MSFAVLPAFIPFRNPIKRIKKSSFFGDPNTKPSIACKGPVNLLSLPSVFP